MATRCINEVESGLEGRQRNEGDVGCLDAEKPLTSLTGEASAADRPVRLLRSQPRYFQEKVDPGYETQLAAIDRTIAEAMRELDVEAAKARKPLAAAQAN